jgi:NADH-quinone oxidoreductase subunit B
VIRSYLPALVFVGLGTILGLVFAVLNTYIGPKTPRRAATTDPYECGLPSEVKKNLPGRRPAEGVRELRAGRDHRLRCPVDHRLRVRLAERSARMEVTRQKLGAGGMQDFRSRQLTARQMLKGEMEGADLEKYVEESVLTTTLDKAARWAAANAIFPATFGLACCAIEMMSIVGARVDVARFGGEAFRASPRQADLLILSGRVSIKMAPVVRRIYDQMIEPRWAIAMGACSSSMGVFNNYAIVPADKFMPVDVHVPGCPPRPEALMHGILKLRAMILAKPDLSWRTRYGGRGTEEFVESELAIEPVAGHSVGVSGGGRMGTSA